ncbi:LacI family DNA-binding transcriptional regulator [Solitalea lacus]|uniref:LacI family DNA-binding transcriptional regulator n=1 Tax=Solitalea lacus TaxID=2911172 RepID=UPI001ED9E3D6|nr:LacI family DNA-binding transcriptional regulator [Solitalea lacus]UKJ06896.1 LacI family transcriptional regulator [Solitalea lacus]
MKKTSLKDIAKLTGVSPSTVSFVLNGKAKEMRISEELTNKIITIAQEVGYQPNQVAVSLRTGKSKMLGVLVETITSDFFSSLAKTIENEAGQYGYKVVLSSTDNDSQKGSEIISMLSQRQIDGYLITPALGMENAINDLINHKKPVVFVDSNLPDFSVPYVAVDNFSGVQMGMNHLIEKGRKNIGFVTIDIELEHMQQRTKAYINTLKENQIELREELILQLPYDYNKEGALTMIQNWIGNLTDLDAIFFATNYLGIIGLESILNLGLRIPQDIAMICFDDHDLFRLYPPGITCIQQPVEDIAKTATNILMEMIESTNYSSTAIQKRLPLKLIIRGSA